MDPEALYQQLREIVASMPSLDAPNGVRSVEVLTWLGRAAALIEASGDVLDSAKFRGLCDQVGMYWNPAEVRTVLYRALGRAELAAPAAARGAFIAVGARFDLFATLAKILAEAKNSVLIVDPYLDSTVVVDFAPLVPEGIPLHLLADGKYLKPSLKPAVERWQAQHASARPLEARATAAGALHDRLVLIDGDQAWALSQSLKDFANRAPGSVVRMDAEITALKMSAYAGTWQASSVL